MSKWAIRDLPSPSAFIQWKGTDVCMDCFCTCGKGFHLHGEFAYAVKCPYCQQVFEMSSVLEMRKLEDGETWDGCDPIEGTP